ncbi:MAG: helix-turn-helix domain-containing protein [Oligoflexia bacterium]|nr:helix-turn-helix domain-containing protein [Oligoflexia bacterium]
MNTKKRTKKVTSKNFFDTLKTSVEEGVKHAKGLVSLKTETLELPDTPPTYSVSEIKKLRKELNVSQPVFASYLGCTPQTVKGWEQGRIKPSAPTRRLLQVLSSAPNIVIGAIFGSSKKRR